MLNSAYRDLIYIVPVGRGKPLFSEESNNINKLQINLNTIYIHLMGALDNFAWCFLYENYLTEKDCRRIDIGLFTRNFRKLECFSSINQIMQFDEWYKEVRNRRDPAAHRIPLAISPAILTTNEEVTKFLELQERYNELVINLDFKAARHEMDAMTHIGRFPSFFHHDPEGPQIPIYPTIPTDMANLIKIGNIIRESLKYK